jgi:hypothetical protein
MASARSGRPFYPVRQFGGCRYLTLQGTTGYGVGYTLSKGPALRITGYKLI